MTKMIDAKLWIRPADTLDNIAITEDSKVVEIIAYTIDKQKALCLVKPKNIFKPLLPQVIYIEVAKLKAAFLKTNKFTLIVDYPFNELLHYSSFKLLLNEKKITAVYFIYATTWQYFECDISIPDTK